MKVSVIVAVYKDVEALDLIVQSLKGQTYPHVELVVAEDGESKEMAAYVPGIEGIEVKHTTQEDTGIRKSRSQNNGILASTGDYLVFIDGDCIPFSTFVEAHVQLADPSAVLTGRRVNLGKTFSQKLRSGAWSSRKLEKNFYLNYFRLKKDDNASHIEQGIRFRPNGLLYRLISAKRRTGILGCNFSLHRENMLRVNGFDESYHNTSLGDDVDLSWRFRAAGLTEKSCKNAANLFHLDHGREHHAKNTEKETALMNEKQERNEFVTRHGTNLHW